MSLNEAEALSFDLCTWDTIFFFLSYFVCLAKLSPSELFFDPPYFLEVVGVSCVDALLLIVK